ncbi:MAG: hypothetical protein AAGA20_00795 [Planctomycetota bacterium]
MKPLTGTLLLAAAVATANAGRAQQQLFGLDQTGIIYEVVGYDLPGSTLVPVVQLALGANETPLALAASPSGRLFVHTVSGSTGEIVEVDRTTGQRTALCATSGALRDGLDRRFDGTLIFEIDSTDFVLLDPDSCATTVVQASTGLAGNSPFVSLAFDDRGRIVSVGGSGTSARFDALDGALSGTFAAPMFDDVRALEVDLDGTVYFALVDGQIFAAGAQLFDVTPSNAVPLTGLAFTQPADGQGMTIACGGVSNSTGAASTIEVLGNAVVSSDDFELRSRSLPVGSFGYYLTGRAFGTTPVGSGVLCIASPVQRYSNFVQNAGVGGMVRFEVDLTMLPNGSPVLAGETHLFQYWHRDVGGTSNLSSAVEVLFR